jgi:hypothetical protein
MIVYVAGYATGLGNIPWQQGELFRLDVRGIGTSLCTATNWSCNLLIAATFLSLMKAATPAGAFAIYSSVCALSWVFTYLCYPETSGCVPWVRERWNRSLPIVSHWSKCAPCLSTISVSDDASSLFCSLLCHSLDRFKVCSTWPPVRPLTWLRHRLRADI